MLLQIQTQTGATCRPLVLVPVLVLGIVALSLHLWWTFRRVKGMFLYLFSLIIEMMFNRQMNMGHPIFNALCYHMDGLKKAGAIYDIACQWCIHFWERVYNSPHLNIGQWTEDQLIAAVGKFHLSAHVSGCFTKFSPNFIRGIGQGDGEILETLWSLFNMFSNSTRAMSRCHCRELNDNHMLDGNWKKLVSMGKSYNASSCFGTELLHSPSPGKEVDRCHERHKIIEGSI